MSEKSRKRKRRNRFATSMIILSIALGIFVFSAVGPGRIYAAPDVIYKPPQPPPVDLKTIPDPFLSYLVRQQRNEAALKEKNRLAAENKRKQEERKLAKMKAAAAEKLRRMREPRTELQKLDLGQLTLTAIIQDGGKNWAMVRDESGMGYILKKGTAIGTMGGRVAKISGVQKKVVVNEPYLEKELHIKYKPKVIELPDEVFE